MSGVPSSGRSFRKPPPEGDGTDPPKRKRYWWRFSLASLIIVYHLKDKEKARHGAYRMVGVFGPEYEPNYLGVQGIQGWEDPPILEDPTETKTVGGREYLIYTDSGKIKLVAWHRGESTYWISNSLQQSLTNEQMMGIAESCRLISGR